MQPTRLNVVKNDSDTWDYTNPNLGNLLFFLINNVNSAMNFGIFKVLEIVHCDCKVIVIQFEETN